MMTKQMERPENHKWTFVLRDKGTPNQGWWLKITSVDELILYMQETNPTRFGKVFENFLYGKEYNDVRPGSIVSNEHEPHPEVGKLTQAVVMYAQSNECTIFDAISGFEREVAKCRLMYIQEFGGFYINRRGGHTFMWEGDVEYGFVRREEFVWPNFTCNDIRVSSFPGGQHFYAYVDDVQVREGSGNDTKLKWDTYHEAYQAALSYINQK